MPLVGSYRVEVAQESRREILVRIAYRAEHILNGQLCLAVGVDSRKRECFIDRHLFGHTVNRCRGAENYLFAAVLFHSFEQRECTAEVVLIIHQRFANAFRDCLVSGKMDHRFNVVFREYLLHIRFIAHIGFIEPEILAAYFLYQLYRFGLGVVEIIHYYYLFSRFQKLDAGMGADISCSARY